MSDEATRLPPIPDRLLVPSAKNLVIAWLRGLVLPERYASRALREWARYVGVQLEAQDYVGLRGGPEHLGPEE